MSTTTAGATIFYTYAVGADPALPTHNGSTPGSGTYVYTGSVTVTNCVETFFKAIAYKSGMSDSDVSSYDADYTNGNHCGGGGGTAPMSASTTTTIFSVWDGDWAILEEYDSSGTRVEAYVQGYHGLVKTLVSNIYYYQDELGSTSHIAGSSGALLEYYKYDLYGKPTYWSPANSQLPSSNYGTKDLFTGQRWVPELGLYDDRNRFMSPDLGRFLQPDPIGFKGDSSNLYRYCGNDWANRSDPMGTDGWPIFQSGNTKWQEDLHRDTDREAQQSPRLSYATALSHGVHQTYFVHHPIAGSNQNLTMGFSGLAGRIDAARSDAAAATVKRSALDKNFSDPYVGNGVEKIPVYSRPWVEVRYQFEGKAAAPGTIVSESRSIKSKSGMYEPYEFKALRPQRISEARTMKDMFSAPFVRPDGYATFSQTLKLSSGVTTTWNTTLHASGAYEIEPSTATFH